MYGQESSLFVPRPQPKREAGGIYLTGAGHPGLGRRGLSLSLMRQDANHARPALKTGAITDGY